MVQLQKMGGIAALYIAAAYLAAIPYFLLVVNYPGVTDPVQKVLLLKDRHASMYAMHVVVYEFVAIALVVLCIALYHRLKPLASSFNQLAVVIGLIWACLLLASSMVFNYGMDAAIGLYATNPTQAVWTWQVIEPVAMGLGGAGGELLGGVWMLLVSVTAMRTNALPKALNGLGVVVAFAGLASMVPPMRNASIVFGLLHILWFVWIGVTMVRRAPLD